MFLFTKKNKHGMLISELYRLFTVKKLLIGILLTSGIAVFSVSDSISLESIYLSREFKQSICDQLQLSLTFDRYKSLYVIATSLCTVTMVPSDIKNHVLPYIRQRSDTNEMIVSRLISVALYIIVVIIMGFLLAGILLTPFMVIETRGSASYGIFMPLMKGALATQLMLWFMGIWNDYLAPTIFLRSEKNWTLQVVIRSFNSYYAIQSDYALIMAASVIAMIPTMALFFIFQRMIIESIAISGIK